MHEFAEGKERLINRDLPDMSTLLRYGLPPVPQDELGPANPSNHPVEIDPPFAGRKDRDYRAILDWIETLSIPAPDYGISLK